MSTQPADQDVSARAWVAQPKPRDGSGRFRQLQRDEDDRPVMDDGSGTVNHG